VSGVVSDPAHLLRRLRSRAAAGAAAAPAPSVGAPGAEPPAATKLESAPPEGAGAAAVHSAEGASGVGGTGCGVAGAPAPRGAPPGAAGAPPSQPARAHPRGAWLDGIAAALRAALVDGAEREADPEGWLVLVRPDGRRGATAPHIVAELVAAGVLPALPEARETVEAALRARPPSWSAAEDVPRPGDRCHCGGRRWWREAGETPRGWRCAACHPPCHLPPEAVREART
jgi:hypothetical protein